MMGATGTVGNGKDSATKQQSAELGGINVVTGGESAEQRPG